MQVAVTCSYFCEIQNQGNPKCQLSKGCVRNLFDMLKRPGLSVFE